ncbi:MAG: hypothetical protein ACLGIV_03575 [Actinomycetes bacterium]
MPGTRPGQVLSFVPRDHSSALFAVLNLSPTTRTVTVTGRRHHGRF